MKVKVSQENISRHLVSDSRIGCAFRKVRKNAELKTGPVHLSADWAILPGHVSYTPPHTHTPHHPDRRVGILGPLLLRDLQSIPIDFLNQGGFRNSSSYELGL